MPLYEYYCEPCNGIFEELRPMREATLAVPCPVCFKDANRIMPTSFAAFTFRDGYPRRIPDDGKYYHLGKKVNKLAQRARPNEHPEVNKPTPPKRLLAGEKSAIRDMQEAAAKGELQNPYGTAVKPEDVTKLYRQRLPMKKGTPKRGVPGDK